MERHQRGLPCAPIQTTAEVYAHEQTHALGIIGKPAEDEIGLVGLPLSFDGKRPPPLSSAPTIGQHNARLDETLHAITPHSFNASGD